MGYKMKNLGKHMKMGGLKMMGGDKKKKPMEKMPSAHQNNIDKHMEVADKINRALQEKMDGTGSPDIDLRKAAYYTKAFFNKAKDLEKKGPYSGIDLSKTSKFGPYAPSKKPRFTDGTRPKYNRRTMEMILPDLGPVPKTSTKRGSRKSKK